jgi:hypothetical protein
MTEQKEQEKIRRLESELVEARKETKSTLLTGLTLGSWYVLVKPALVIGAAYFVGNKINKTLGEVATMAAAVYSLGNLLIREKDFLEEIGGDCLDAIIKYFDKSAEYKKLIRDYKTSQETSK